MDLQANIKWTFLEPFGKRIYPGNGFERNCVRRKQTSTEVRDRRKRSTLTVGSKKARPNVSARMFTLQQTRYTS